MKVTQCVQKKIHEQKEAFEKRQKEAFEQFMKAHFGDPICQETLIIMKSKN